MRIAMALLAVSLVFGSTACKKKPKEGATGDNMGSSMGSANTGSDTGSAVAGSAAGSDSGSGSAAAGSGAGSGSDTGSAAMGSGAGSDTGSGAGSGDPQMAHKGGNCPSTVLGATTTAKVEKNVVVVSITATDKDAIAAIHRRTAELMKEKADKTAQTGAAHDQKGTHGGASGLCPVYFKDGTGTQTTTKTGTEVRITPRDGKAEDLKKKIDERIAKTNEWVKANVKPGDKGNEGGVGGGSGEHGSNHSGEGDSKGVDRKKGDGSGGGKGTGGGKGAGTGGGGSGSGKSS
jgi:hypothetical protein